MQESTEAAFLREQAEKCLRLAKSINDEKAVAALRDMALEYQTEASRLEELAMNGKPYLKAKLPPAT